MQKSALFALMLLCSFVQLSCQLPNEPTAINVPAVLRIRVRDQANTALPGSKVFLIRKDGSVGVSPTAIDEATSTYIYQLEVPIIGEAYTIIANPPQSTATTTYSPLRDSLTFIMPCRDHLETIVFTRHDSVPCGTNIERTLDFETVCVDADTTISLVAGIFTHNCTPPATITSVTATTINGFTNVVSFENPQTPITTYPTSWQAGRGLSVKVTYTSVAHQPFSLDGNDIVINVAPNVTITIHLKGKGILCKHCDCPQLDSVSFGLDGTGKDTNQVDIGDPAKLTTIDLSSITNSNDQSCDLLVTQLRSFKRPELRVLSFGGASGATAATLSSKQTLGSMIVEFTPIVRGEFVDTSFYKIQKRASDGTITDCDTLPIIYHGKVVLGICTIDTIKTNGYAKSFLKNDTIANCIGVDENFRMICIKNTGDGKLRFDLKYLLNDPQFQIRYDTAGVHYNGETITLAPGASECFSIRFVPDGNKVLATKPPTTIFNNSIVLCNFTLRVVGQAYPVCIHCLDGAISQYGITTTSYGGFVFVGTDQFTFNSTPTIKPDIYATAVTSTAITLESQSGTTFQLVQSNYTPSKAGIKFCDDPIPAGAKALCGSGGTSTITASIHDLIIFRSASGQCGLIYIDNIILSNGVWVAVFQASYPI